MVVGERKYEFGRILNMYHMVNITDMIVYFSQFYKSQCYKIDGLVI